MNTNVILTKQSAETEIRAYFEGVMRLSQTNEQFPVNLDEVWPLVYSHRKDAIATLKRTFIENVDYQVSRENPQNPIGGRPTEDYHLSLSCLEYFIARKVRPVFEVYRKVFHKAAEAKPLSGAEYLLQQAQLMVEQERRISRVETKLDRLISQQQENEAELKALPLSPETAPEMSLRDKIRLLINRYCNFTGLGYQVVWDNVYQSLLYKYHIMFHIDSTIRIHTE